MFDKFLWVTIFKYVSLYSEKFQDGLMSVGLVTDSELCETISKNEKESRIIFRQVKLNEEDEELAEPKIHVVKGSDTKEIADKVLELLPEPKILDEEKFKVIH